MKLEFETDDGIGTRATLGVIVLEADETLEPEFSSIMTELDGVALYHNRIPMVPEITSETLSRMEKDLPAVATMFPQAASFDVIGYGCTSASTVIGPDRVALAIRQSRPETRVTDPLSALIAACRALDAKRLGFLTPYLPEVSERMRDKLIQTGFEIAAFGSFEEGDDRVVARISEKSILDAALALTEQAPCDAIVISCTNLRCLNVIRQVEHLTSIPVLSSNQALAWHMLRLAGIKDVQPAYGQLFTLTGKPVSIRK